MQQPPTVDAVRPACCPRCGLAARVPGLPFGLVGHGLRERQLRGPPSATEGAKTRSVLVRCYRCRGCKAVVRVVPRGVVARRHFGAGAIGLALYVFGKLAKRAAEAAEGVGCWSRGAGAWRTLRRWLGAIDDGKLFPCVRGSPPGWRPRQRAERAAMTLASIVPATTADLREKVFAGAALAA